jgi:hypothetical protein
MCVDACGCIFDEKFSVSTTAIPDVFDPDE